jgi:hypothetical protein
LALGPQDRAVAAGLGHVRGADRRAPPARLGRGRRATRWVYAGALLLLLAYVGARFVLEVVLQRGTA